MASDLANQTPLPFALDDGKTYDKKGEKKVWAQSGQSGLDKRQVTIQLTVFADGVDRVRSTVIFRGKSLRISAKEKQSYDLRVKFMHHEKAWCDRKIMKQWISIEWANSFKNPISQNSDWKILIADVRHTQQSDSVKQLLKKHKTSPVNVRPSCKSRVQVVDVLINKKFKEEVRSFFEDHLDRNLDQYVDGKINGSQRRVFMTKWVGEACSKVGRMKDSVIRSFKKCGLSMALDGSENDEGNIEGMPSAFVNMYWMNMYWM